MAARGPQRLSQLLRIAQFLSGQLVWKLSDLSRHIRQRAKLAPTLASGRRGEDLAHRYLRSCGYEILSRNFRLPDGSGEIDIIAQDGTSMVFIEVKTRRSAEYGSPERAVGAEKEKKIIRTARFYALRAHADWTMVRFDIVSVILQKQPQIIHYKDAFHTGRR